MGLKLEMSKHFAYPHICSINHDKIWISLSFKDLKIASCNCSLVLSHCLLVSKIFHDVKTLWPLHKSPLISERKDILRKTKPESLKRELEAL